jgi:hypothetical protein
VTRRIAFSVLPTMLLAIAATAVAGGTPKTIPSGSRIYVARMDGFETYVIAAINKKKVPVTVTTKRENADFEITGAAESEKPGWAKVIFKGQIRSDEQASINVVNLKTADVVFAYNVHKGNSVRGKQSAAEACAKHLKEAIE